MAKAERKSGDTFDDDADFAASFVLNRDDVARALSSTSAEGPESPPRRTAIGTLATIGLRNGLVCVAVVALVLLLLVLIL